MSAFILLWNPEQFRFDDYQTAVLTTKSGDLYPDYWSTGSRSGGISVGDTAYLLRTTRERGIVARGSFSSQVHSAPHWNGSGRHMNVADVLWDTVLDIEARIRVEVLVAQVPDGDWNHKYGSGNKLNETAAEALNDLWLTHVGLAQYRSPEELQAETLFPEGGLVRVEANRYERDLRARAACIAHYGLRCKVCGLNFEEVYGEIGKGFIHVHHLRELSTFGESYSIDPKEDLRPVCPNCHAMLHRRKPALSLEELRAELSSPQGVDVPGGSST